MGSGGKGSRATIIGYDYYASFAGVAGYPKFVRTWADFIYFCPKFEF